MYEEWWGMNNALKIHFKLVVWLMNIPQGHLCDDLCWWLKERHACLDNEKTKWMRVISVNKQCRIMRINLYKTYYSFALLVRDNIEL